MNARKRFKAALLLLLGFSVIGTAGYMVIEGASFMDAAYMTLITISTVGYSETIELSLAGRVFTMALIATGVGSVFYASVSLVTIFVEGELRSVRESRRMQKQIQQLKNHVLVCGYGRMGERIAVHCKLYQMKVVILDNNTDRLQDAEKEGLLFVKGDAAEESVLREAGIERAKTLVATLPRDSDNVYVTLTARGLNPDLFIIARSESSMTEAKLMRAGADRVVCPQDIGAARISSLVTRPNVVDFVDFAAKGVELEIDEYHINPGSRLAGKTLQESNLRNKVDAMVVAIKRHGGESIYNPTANIRIEAGDTLIMIGRLNTSRRLSQLDEV